MAFDRRETITLIVGDFLILVASLWTALFLRTFAVPSVSHFEANVVPFLPMFLISLVIFYIAGLYEKQTRPIRRSMGLRILGAQAATVGISAILFFTLPFSIAPKTILVLYLIVSVCAESVWRFHRMTREMSEENRVPAVLVGSGATAQELYDEIRANDRYLVRFVGYIPLAERTVADTAEDLLQHIHHGARVAVIDMRTAHVREIMQAVNNKEVLFRDLSAMYEEVFDRVSLDAVDTRELFAGVTKQHYVYDSAKRLFDISLVLVGSVIAIPFIVVAAIALMIEGGSPFFRHERIGKNGKIISMLKLRSMLLNDHGDPELQKKNRVTTLGKLLRKTRIDELPQLWNILVGDLSFIGPRPELPKIAEVYQREIPHYEMRHLITPGLSGWAQTRDYDVPRGGADIERTKHKLSYDLFYLKHRSFGLDLAIALKTIRALFAFSGT